MNTQSSLIADTTQRIFRELGDPQSMRSAENKQSLWRALEDAGLTRAWIGEALNGAGASIADGFDILRIAGAHAVSVPLVESLLAGWLLERAQISLPEGPLTLAPVDTRDRIAVTHTQMLSGSARAVPLAREASHVVIVAERDNRNFIALVDRAQCTLELHENVAGDARDSIKLTNAATFALVETSISMDAVMLMGAAARSMQMAGALQTVLDLSVAYANERVAFEKPIGKFQAIQHSLAKLAGETAAAIAAAGSAADAIASSSFDDSVFLEVASAKIRIGEAVTVGAAIAHQVHGAIGFSQEHVLHRYTQRLWAWRDDFGSETEWSVKLGKLIARNGADALWPMLAAR